MRAPRMRHAMLLYYVIRRAQQYASYAALIAATLSALLCYSRATLAAPDIFTRVRLISPAFAPYDTLLAMPPATIHLFFMLAAPYGADFAYVYVV